MVHGACNDNKPQSLQEKQLTPYKVTICGVPTGRLSRIERQYIWDNAFSQTEAENVASVKENMLAGQVSNRSFKQKPKLMRLRPGFWKLSHIAQSDTTNQTCSDTVNRPIEDIQLD